MRFFSSYKLLLVVMALAIFACAQQETSLGELAKRKGTKKAKIVIGDDDVLHSTAGSQPDAAADTGNGAAADAAASGNGAGAKPTQSGSAKSSDPQIAELKDKIDKLSSQEDAVKGALKTNQNRMANAQSDFQREVAQESISNNTHNIDVLSQQRKEAEAQLKALQDSKKK